MRITVDWSTFPFCFSGKTSQTHLILPVAIDNCVTVPGVERRRTLVVFAWASALPFYPRRPVSVYFVTNTVWTANGKGVLRALKCKNRKWMNEAEWTYSIHTIMARDIARIFLKNRFLAWCWGEIKGTTATRHAGRGRNEKKTWALWEDTFQLIKFRKWKTNQENVC